MANLPDHIISKIADPVERKRHGPTWAEAVERDTKEKGPLEQEIHNQFDNWLRRHGFRNAYHPSFVRPSTIKEGMPDYGVTRDSRIIYIEFKVKPNKLSPAQELRIHELRDDGNTVCVCYSYTEAAEAVSKFFNLNL